MIFCLFLPHSLSACESVTLSFQVLHFQECGYLPGGGEEEVREEEGGVKGEGEERKKEGEGLSNSGAFPASKKKKKKREREGTNTEFV